MLFSISIISVIVLLIWYWYSTRTFNYWKVRNIKYEKTLPLLGNSWKIFLQKSSIGMQAVELYNKYPNEKAVGFFVGNIKCLLVRDPEITKRVLVADFNNFHDRGFLFHQPIVEPLLRNMFFMEDDFWRLLRQNLSSPFSPGKIKAMFPLIVKKAESLQVKTEEIADMEYYDANKLMAKFTIETIGECGFGLNLETISDENTHFLDISQRIFHRSISDGIRLCLKLIFPNLFKNLTFLAPEIETTLKYLFKTVLEKRNYKPSGRHDFVDLMLELKQKGDLMVQSFHKKDKNGIPETIRMELSDTLMMAQMFVFFAAGFETSSATSSYTLHQLAFNPDCQEKVQAEIDQVLEKYNGKITYDAIKEMTYLEMCFYEATRIFPPVPILLRKCVPEKYTIPELNVTIDKDVLVVVSTKAMQVDEKYFPEPTKFDPERFSDSKEVLNSFVYFPFGKGPRICVGARLGLMQSMAGIVAVLQKYTVEPAACSVRTSLVDPKAMIVEVALHGIPLKFRRRIK